MRAFILFEVPFYQHHTILSQVKHLKETVYSDAPHSNMKNFWTAVLMVHAPVYYIPIWNL